MDPTSPTVILTWVNQYGLPTVFAVILLVFVLWQMATVQKQNAAALAEITKAVVAFQASLSQVTSELGALGDTQEQQARTMAEMQRAFERLHDRMDPR